IDIQRLFSMINARYRVVGTTHERKDNDRTITIGEVNSSI
ncbi:unnamed protein product, partial [Rotaria magnacalcarata]